MVKYKSIAERSKIYFGPNIPNMFFDTSKMAVDQQDKKVTTKPKHQSVLPPILEKLKTRL